MSDLMTARRWRALLIVAVLAGLDLFATIRSHLEWHRVPNGPQVMPLGQLVGWMTSVVLIIAAALIVVDAWYSRRRDDAIRKPGRWDR